jgi:hypothetical protein
MHHCHKDVVILLNSEVVDFTIKVIVMCESNLTSKSQLILRNLDLVLVSSDGDDMEEYGSTGHGPQGMFLCYTSYSHINLAGLRYQCCPAHRGCVFF